MSKKHIRIIAVISVIAVCGASVGYIAYSGIWKDWIAGEWTNRYSYWFYVDTSDELHNVTLYIPALMVKGEIASIVKDINNHSSKPSDWVCEYIDTVHGRMLRISTDAITVGYHSIKIETHNVGHIINTENPVSGEPTFYPRLNDTGTEYKSYIYGSYNTSSNNKITISLRIRGEKYRGMLGATDLQGYEDKIEHTLRGEWHEWHVVNGILKKG